MDKPVIGVIGLGTMGLGIAQTYAQAGFTVLASDVQAATRATAMARLDGKLSERAAAGKLSPEALKETLARVTIVDGPEDFGQAVMVIEAIVESIAAKRELFSRLEDTVSSDAVLASNTSSLAVSTIAEGLKYPGRVLGLHFFNPAPAMKLVELIGHGATSDAALATARRLTEMAGKVVIACPDRPGFIVNRCARPFYGEALALLEEGRCAAEIDAAMVAAGYRMGPFALIDLIGADINLAATRGLSAAMGGHPRYHVFDSLVARVERNELGRKSGRGFVFPDAAIAAPDDADRIVLRIEAALANEAASLLDEGGIGETDIDTALKLGLNFPRGPFQSARRHGLALVRATLADLAASAPDHLKGRYDISEALEAMS